MSSLEEAEAEAGGSPARSFDVVVIGGGQTGLATAWHLKRQGLRYVVLEAADQLGDSWRARWSSLRLFTPAEYDALPGMPFPAPDGTYPGKDAVADYLRGYVEAADLDVELGSRVTGLSRTDGGFEVRTADTAVRADQVVVATGPFQAPFIPPAAGGSDSSVTQVHSAGYCDPRSLPEGSVLVVGGGNSGFQIAEELAGSREVPLSGAEPNRTERGAEPWSPARRSSSRSRYIRG